MMTATVILACMVPSALIGFRVSPVIAPTAQVLQTAASILMNAPVTHVRTMPDVSMDLAHIYVSVFLDFMARSVSMHISRFLRVVIQTLAIMVGVVVLEEIATLASAHQDSMELDAKTVSKSKEVVWVTPVITARHALIPAKAQGAIALWGLQDPFAAGHSTTVNSIPVRMGQHVSRGYMVRIPVYAR